MILMAERTDSFISAWDKKLGDTHTLPEPNTGNIDAVDEYGTIGRLKNPEQRQQKLEGIVNKIWNLTGSTCR